MTHEIKVFGEFCSTEVFTINGKSADSDDFGGQGDYDSANAEDYACGDMQFEQKPPTADVLAKYEIDELEYWTIANKLAEELSFGCCGLCA